MYRKHALQFFSDFWGPVKSFHCFYIKILKSFSSLSEFVSAFYIFLDFFNYMNMIWLSKYTQHKMVIHAKIDSSRVRVVLSRWTHSEPKTIFTGTAPNTPNYDQNSVGHAIGPLSMSLLGSGLRVLLMLVLLLSLLFASWHVPRCHLLPRLAREGQPSSGHGEAWGTELSKVAFIVLSLPRWRVEYTHN